MRQVNLITNLSKPANVIFTAKLTKRDNKVTVDFRDGVLKQGPLGPSLGKSGSQTREFLFDFREIKPTYI